MPRANAAYSSTRSRPHSPLLGSRRAYYTMDVTTMLTRIHLQEITRCVALEWAYPVHTSGFFPNAASRHRIL